MLGLLPGNVTQSSYQLAKKGTLSHSRFPFKTVPIVSGHHTEHARLISLKERITPSSNSFSFDLVSQYQYQIISVVCSLSKLPLQLLLYHTNPKLLVQLLLAVTNTPFNYSTLKCCSSISLSLPTHSEITAIAI